jgi:tetratricopeptide (TPR) repeat protein
LEIDPSNADARYNSGLSYFRLATRYNNKKSLVYLSKAKEQINKLLIVEPDYPSAYRDLGLIELNRFTLSSFEHEGELILSDAQKAFEQCVALDPDNDGCYEGLGHVFVEKAHYDKAFVNYFLCLSHEPTNSACRKHIALAYEKSAHAENSYEFFSQTLKADSKNAFAHEAFCAALFERGLDTKAREQCHKALALKSNLCSAHYRLADHYNAVLDSSRAQHHCREYLLCDSSKEMLIHQNRCREIIISVKR